MIDKYLDHHYLNESTNLENPTSEKLARWIFNYLQEDGLESLYAVEICEPCTSACTYFGGNNDYYCDYDHKLAAISTINLPLLSLKY